MSSGQENSKRMERRLKRHMSTFNGASKKVSNTRIHLSEEGSNLNDISNTHIFSQEVLTPSTKESHTSKKTRGRTKCKTIATNISQKIDVDCNESGQNVGKGSIKLSSYVGCLVREMMPIGKYDWRDVPKAKKEAMWEVITQKFNFKSELQYDKVMKGAGNLWRKHRSELRTQVRKAEDKYAMKPDNIDIADWEDFLRQMSSPKFIKKSNKFKEMRNKQLPHTMSRKGYARLEQDMKNESSDPSSIDRVKVWIRGHTKKDGTPSNAIVAEHFKNIEKFEAPPHCSLKDDALTEVLGPDRGGRIRGLGFGVNQTELSAISKSSCRVTQLEEEVRVLKGELTKMDGMQSKMVELEKIISELRKNKDQDVGMNEKTCAPNPSDHDKGIKQVGIEHIFTPTPMPQRTSHKPVECKLLNFIPPHDIVAFGEWMTSDQGTLVHHVPLGHNASKVCVMRVYKPSVPVWRPNDEIEIISQALGSFIAWPTDCLIIGSGRGF